jgi:hypothetical protein
MKSEFRIANVGEGGRDFWLVEANATEIRGSDDVVARRRTMVARALGVPAEAVALYYPPEGLIRGTPPYPGLIAAGQKQAGAPWETRELDIR